MSILLLKSTFFIKWFFIFYSILFNPIGFKFGFANFNIFFKIKSFWDWKFNIVNVFYVPYNTFSNYIKSQDPAINITLFIFFPPFNYIDFFIIDFVSSAPKLCPIKFISWWGNILWITYAIISPVFVAKSNVFTNGFLFPTDIYSIFFPKSSYFGEDNINFSIVALLLLSHCKAYT